MLSWSTHGRSFCVDQKKFEWWRKGLCAQTLQDELVYRKVHAGLHKHIGWKCCLFLWLALQTFDRQQQQL